MRQGQRIHLLLHLRNATEADPRGVGIVLLRRNKPVSGVRAGGQAVRDPESRTIRYAAFIDTDSLATGKYSILLTLPNGGSRKIRRVAKDFTWCRDRAFPAFSRERPLKKKFSEEHRKHGP